MASCHQRLIRCTLLGAMALLWLALSGCSGASGERLPNHDPLLGPAGPSARATPTRTGQLGGTTTVPGTSPPVGSPFPPLGNAALTHNLTRPQEAGVTGLRIPGETTPAGGWRGTSPAPTSPEVLLRGPLQPPAGTAAAPGVIPSVKLALESPGSVTPSNTGTPSIPPPTPPPGNWTASPTPAFGAQLSFEELSNRLRDRGVVGYSLVKKLNGQTGKEECELVTFVRAPDDPRAQIKGPVGRGADDVSAMRDALLQLQRTQ